MLTDNELILLGIETEMSDVAKRFKSCAESIVTFVPSLLY